MTQTSKAIVLPIDLDVALSTHRISVSPTTEPVGSGSEFYAFAFDRGQDDAQNAFGKTPSDAVYQLLKNLGVPVQTEEEHEAAYQESLLPKKLSTTAEIPHPAEKVFFFQAADNPEKDTIHRILRLKNDVVFAFIGRAPEFMRDFTQAGYPSYELPEGTEPLLNSTLARPHHAGDQVRWGYDRVGHSEVLQLFGAEGSGTRSETEG
ncbi:hypothetical protein ABH908_000041 [Pseudomonas frederiksbergensis]|uniref:hypothetical protein n=1 Tax=Pseudomonas TaxID=286 RepID=UPI003D1C963B